MADQQLGSTDPNEPGSQQQQQQQQQGLSDAEMPGPTGGAAAAASEVLQALHQQQHLPAAAGEHEDINLEDFEEEDEEGEDIWGLGEDFDDEDEDYAMGLPELLEDEEEDDEHEHTEMIGWGYDDDDTEERISIEKRVELECGLLASDAHLLEDTQPIRHTAINSTVVHHQTADVLTLLPAPAPPEEAAAAVAAAAAGADVRLEGDSSSEEAAAAAAAAAAVGGVATLPPEDVVVSCKGVLSVYRLQAGQSSKLMARSNTLFRPYSLAASTCGNYVATTGNGGLLSLFRVVRSSSSDDGGGAGVDAAGGSNSRGDSRPAGSTAAAAGGSTAAAAQQAPGAEPAAAAADAAGQEQQAAAEEEEPVLPWQLLHVATLMCRNGAEMMVNSVRFGHFAGRLRMLVAHQDGMVYLFDLPDQQQAAAAAGSTTGSRSSSGRLPAAAVAGAAAGAAAAGPGSAAHVGDAAALMVSEVPDWDPLVDINTKYVKQLLALLDPLESQWYNAAAAANAQQPGAAGAEHQQQQQQQEHLAQGTTTSANAAPAVAAADGTAAAAAPAAAAGAPTLRQQLSVAISQAQGVLGVLANWMQHEAPVCREVAGALLGDEGKQPLLPTLAPPPPQSSPCSWYACRARFSARMLTHPACLQQLQSLARYRLSYSSGDALDHNSWLQDPYKITAIQQWPAAVEALRSVAATQWALLGALGQEQQEQQWQRLQAEGETDRETAMARAVYVLVLLRLLGPIVQPSIRPGVKVLVLRSGAKCASERLTAADLSGATQLATCAITNLVRDEAADRAAQAALAHATANIEAIMAQPGLSQEVQGAAAVALADATRAAAQPNLLPLNIVEASPDGQWLAVGSDLLAVVLVPAGAGYQHQMCHVLDVCPWGEPRMDAAPNVWAAQQGALGCQYLSFNSSSTLLAASCDALRLVVVWGVAGPGLGQRVASFSLHNRTVLPLRFLPPHHPLTALQHGVGAGARAAAEAAADAAAAEAAAGTVGIARVLQMHAGASALAPEAVAAAAVLQPGAVGRLSDRLLAYCECFGGLHLADMSMWFHAPRLPQTRTSPHFCLKTYLELSQAQPNQQQQQGVVTAAAVADQLQQQQEQQEQQQEQEQQQQQGGDAEMADAEAPAVDPAVAEAEAMLDGLLPQAGAVPMPAAQVAPEGAYDSSAALTRITGLVLTPAGRLLVSIPNQLLEWKLVTNWGHNNHARFPAAFRSAVKTLLLAAAHSNSSQASGGAKAAASSGDSGGSSSSSGQQLLAQLPGPVLEQVCAAAAFPQGCWAAAELPSFAQLCDALEQRPFPSWW